jgi:hypothetical protein
MILPTKYLTEDRALLWVGAEILSLLTEPKTVSRLWDELKKARSERLQSPSITYDWFVLALDLLYSVNIIDLKRGRIWRVNYDSLYLQ